MTALAVDIETVGVPKENLEPGTKEYLKNRGRNNDNEKVLEKLGLNPGTGRIVAIGLWTGVTGGVFLNDPNHELTGEEWSRFDLDIDKLIDVPEEDIHVWRGDEKNILAGFWNYLKSSDNKPVVTYNGRRFDGPYLMLRSAYHDLSPSRNLVPYRYSFDKHCDLAEVINFHGARQTETLDFWCKRMGLQSPKGEMSGADVEKAYNQGQLDKIGTYCIRDVQATFNLYQKLHPVITALN